MEMVNVHREARGGNAPRRAQIYPLKLDKPPRPVTS